MSHCRDKIHHHGKGRHNPVQPFRLPGVATVRTQKNIPESLRLRIGKTDKRHIIRRVLCPRTHKIINKFAMDQINQGISVSGVAQINQDQFPVGLHNVFRVEIVVNETITGRNGVIDPMQKRRFLRRKVFCHSVNRSVKYLGRGRHLSFRQFNIVQLAQELRGSLRVMGEGIRIFPDTFHQRRRFQKLVDRAVALPAAHCIKRNRAGDAQQKGFPTCLPFHFDPVQRYTRTKDFYHLVFCQAVYFAVSPFTQERTAVHGDFPELLVYFQQFGEPGNLQNVIDIRRDIVDGNRTVHAFTQFHQRPQSGG